MLLEQQGAEREQDGERAFRNEDGTPATWLEVKPERTRRQAFAWCAGIGLALALALWILQYTNGALDLARGWFGILPIAIGLALGSLAYRNSTYVRRYTSARVRYTARKRFARAFKWWFASIAIACLIWWVQSEHAQFTEYWWYAWPVLPFFLVGTGLFLRRNGEELSPAAKKAKTYFNMLEQQASASSNHFDEFIELPLVRYPIAALCLYGAYYFGVESTHPNAGWGAVAALIVAGVCARELSKWILGIVLFGAIAWAVIAGASALPVSAAIIVGALVIASAMKK